MAAVRSTAVSAMGASRPRRVYHSKAKTGCRTCRIRKVKCDEGKPDCVRCTSTGRKCDGYTTSSPSTSSASASPSSSSVGTPDAAAHLKLILPRQSAEEVRSYQYFLEITAPSLAGAFHAEFWLSDVPRVCLSDAAIWHAIVSLGSAHEDFSEKGRGGSPSLFALKQFNLAIRCLTESRSPRHADRWRALIVSTIFTYICTIKGLHEQTRVHLQAGCSLLRELQSHGSTSSGRGRLQDTAQPESWISSTPIPIVPIESILVNLELQANALNQGGIVGNPTLLSQNRIFNAWRTYTAPLSSSSSYVAIEDVKQAYRAAESLSSGLILFSQEHAKQLGDLQTGRVGSEALSLLVARQESHTRCFQEISRAIDLFQRAIATTPNSREDVTRLEPQSILPLRLFHTTNRLLFIQDPDEPDLIKRQQILPALYASVVDLAEQVMELDPAETRGVSYTQQLFLVAHSGIGQSTRRRAVALLRRPRLEGGWDSLISASLAEAIMEREREATWEFWVKQGFDPEKVEGEEKKEEEVDHMSRIFNITFTFTGSREASAVLRTWREKVNDIPGKARIIRW